MIFSNILNKEWWQVKLPSMQRWKTTKVVNLKMSIVQSAINTSRFTSALWFSRESTERCWVEDLDKTCRLCFMKKPLLQLNKRFLLKVILLDFVYIWRQNNCVTDISGLFVRKYRHSWNHIGILCDKKCLYLFICL